MGALKMQKINLELARRLAVRAQLLDGQTDLPGGKEGVAQVIEDLGYVQVDTIAVIRRAHHHTLWTRRPDYDEAWLQDLQAEDRRVFEYWSHAHSYLPMRDYRYYLPRMHAIDDPHTKWEKDRLAKYGHLMPSVLERIRGEGPLGSGDLERPSEAEQRPDWNPHPQKAAVEMLFMSGEVMITERRNFQRIYDLTERVLPSGVDTRMPDDEELGRFQVQRALSAHGVAGVRDIRKHLQVAGNRVISKVLSDMAEAGDLVSVQIEGDDKSAYFVLADVIELAGKLEQAPPRVHLLCPFDNLIIQRDRISRLFGFDYALECYVTPAKRKHGYFVLPILWGERFVGRLDPKADRKKKTLIIRNLLFEPGFDAADDFILPFAEKLIEFARFNGCGRVEIEQVSPAKVKAPVKRALTDALG